MQATKIPDPKGQYQDAHGTCYRVLAGDRLLLYNVAATAQTVDNLAAFLSAEGLTPVPPPAPTPQSIYEASIAAGYDVPGAQPPLTLALDDKAQQNFTALLLLIASVLARDPLGVNRTQVIYDRQGGSHVLTFGELQSILIGYGEYRAGLLNTLHAATN